MIPWIIQMSIISLILIILVHYLFTFFMTNLTIPKVKDLVNKPQQQYETLYNTMKEQPVLEQKGNENMKNENMKNELKNYLKELSDNTSTSNNSNNSNNNSNISNNVNTLGGLLTGESVGNSGSFGGGGSSSYSTF